MTDEEIWDEAQVRLKEMDNAIAMFEKDHPDLLADQRFLPLAEALWGLGEERPPFYLCLQAATIIVKNRGFAWLENKHAFAGCDDLWRIVRRLSRKPRRYPVGQRSLPTLH